MKIVTYILGLIVGFVIIVPLAVAALPVSFFHDALIARGEVFRCRESTNEEQKEICYQKHIPQLIDEGLSLERSFAVLKRVLVLDRGYQSCHVLSHLLSSREVAKDPDRWKDVLTRVPLDICGAGALHGAFQERFRAESMPDATAEELGVMLEGACDPHGEWQPTPLDQSSCFHGMGHLFLYVTGANVKKSVALCDALAQRPERDFRQTCTEGVFMQVYQPLEADDVALIHAIEKESRDTVKFCKQFTGLVRNACVKESWPAVENSASDPRVFESLCNRIPIRSGVQYCAQGLMYPVIEVLHYDVPTVQNFCRSLDAQDLKDICWSRLASKFVWADHSNTVGALAICEAAPPESQDMCWTELLNFAYGGLPAGSPEVRSLCNGMPQVYREKCADQMHGRL